MNPTIPPLESWQIAPTYASETSSQRRGSPQRPPASPSAAGRTSPVISLRTAASTAFQANS